MGHGQTIYVCGNWAGDTMSGLQRYADSILHEMDRIIGERKKSGLDTLDIVFVAAADSPHYPDYKNIRIAKVGVKGRLGTLHYKILNRVWNYIVFPAYLATHPGFGADLAQAFPGFGLKLCSIHDCIRERYYVGDRGHFQRSYLRKIRWFTSRPHMHFVTVSQNSLRDLMSFYDIPEDRIVAIGNGWEHMNDIQSDPHTLERLGLTPQTKFCFSLGSGHKHKNTEWVVRVAEYNPEYLFLISGNDAESQFPAHPFNVVFTGRLTDGEIKALYQHCSAFLQPSWYEGFAIPPLEALSVGAPIIVANTSCLPEIYRNSARYIEPGRYDYRIDDVLAEEVEGVEDVLRDHSWKTTGQQMYALLERLVSQ